eukprot:365400-Chlamydomonas_euryale.AAC.5
MPDESRSQPENRRRSPDGLHHRSRTPTSRGRGCDSHCEADVNLSICSCWQRKPDEQEKLLVEAGMRRSKKHEFTSEGGNSQPSARVHTYTLGSATSTRPSQLACAVAVQEAVQAWCVGLLCRWNSSACARQ